MPDTTGSFEFSTNLGEVAQQIDRYLGEIEARVSGVSIGGGNTDFLAGVGQQFAQIGTKYAEQVRTLGEETRQSIAQGLSPANFSSQITALARNMRSELSEAASQAAAAFKPENSGVNLRGAIEQYNELASAIVRSQASLERGSVRSAAAGAGLNPTEIAGGTGYNRSLALSSSAIDRVTTDANALHTRLVEFGNSLASAAKATPEQLSLLQRAANGESGSDVDFLRGNVAQTSGGIAFANPATGGAQLIKANAAVESYAISMDELAGEAASLAGTAADTGGAIKTAQERAASAAERYAAAMEEQAAQASRGARGGAGAGGGQPPRGLGNAFLGGLFGHGFVPEAPFDPKAALGNLAGTAGVLLRYGGEGQLLYGGMQQIKDAGKDLVQYQEALTNLQEALGSIPAQQVSLNSAIDAGAQAGIGAADAVNIGAEALRTYSGYVTDAKSATDVMTESVRAAGEAAVLTGQNAQDAFQQLSTATFGYGSGPNGTNRIQDAVVNAQKNFGGNRADILKAVSSASADANEAGIGPEELANIAALVQRDTGANGNSVASEIQKLITRGQNQSFISALQFAGIQNTGNLSQEIPQLSKYFNSLDPRKQQGFITQLGGARAIGDLLPLLRSGDELTQANAKSYEGGGSAAEAFARQIANLGGQLRQVGAELKDIATNVGRSGIFLPLGAGLELLKPGLEVLNEILRTIDDMPGHIGQVGVALAEVYGVMQLWRNGTVQTLFGKASTGVRSAVGGAAKGEASSAAAAGEDQNTAAAERTATAETALAAARERDITAIEAQNAALELQQGLLAGEAGVVERLTVAMGAEGDVYDRLTADRARGLTAIEAENAALLEQSEIMARLSTEGLAGGALGLGTGAGSEAAVASTRWTRTTSVGTAAADVAAFGRRGAATAGAALEDLGGSLRRANLGALAGNMATGFRNVVNGFSPLMTAIVGVVAIMEVLKTEAGIQSALRKSDATGTTGNATVDALHQSASDSANAAAAVAHSSAGFLGTIVNGANRLLGGEGTGQAAQRNREDAELSNLLASRVQAAQDAASAAAGKNGLATQIDLSGTPQNITDNLQNLTAQGYDAGQVLDALTTKLGQFTDAARSGANTILPGQTNVVANQLGAAGSGALRSWYDALGSNGNTTRPEGLLKGVNFGDLGTALTDSANQFFKNNGLTNGGNVSPAQVKALQQTQLKAAIAELKKQGATTAEIQKLMPDLNLAIAAETRHTLQSATGGGISSLNAGQVAALVQNASQLAQQAGQTAGTRASLAGGSGSVAGAQTNLSDLQDLYGKLSKNPNADPKKLQTLRDDIDAAQLQLQQATTQHIQAMADLATSTVSPFDKSGQITAQISSLRSQLANTTDQDARAQLRASINQAQHQLVQQNIQNQTSRIGLEGDVFAGGSPVTSAVAQAKAKLDQATYSYHAIIANGGTGADVTDAQQALYQAQLDYANAQVQDANDARDGAVAVGDKVGQAYAQYLDLLNSASTQSGGARAKTLQQAREQYLSTYLSANASNAAVRNEDLNSQNTVALARHAVTADKINLSTYERLAPQDYADIAAAQKQLNDDRLALKQALNQLRDDRDVSRIDPRSTVSLAHEKITEAQRALVSDDVFSDQYYKDLAALHQAQISLAQAEAQKAADTALANANPASALSQARAKVIGDRDTLRADKPGTDQYEKDLATLHQDRFSLRQANVNTANARLDSRVSQGNDLSQASAEIKKAANNLALYKKGTEEYYAALASLHQAQYDYSQALEAHDAALDQLAGDVSDPVHMALAALQAAQQKLAIDSANHTGDTAQDTLAVEQAQLAAQKAAFDQQNSIEQQMYQLHQISGAQYLDYLESEKTTLQAQLAGMQKGSEGYQQTLEELLSVEADIMSANQQLTGQFNVGSNINLKGAVYQERRLAAQNGIDISADTTGANAFGQGSNPASQALSPLTDAISAVAQPAALAAGYITNLASALGLLTGSTSAQAAASSSVSSTTTNSIQINGATTAELQNFVAQLVGSGAIQTRTPIALRKVG